MPRYKLIIEYDGSPYNGWQYQKNQTTVMGTLMDACKKAVNSLKFELYGAGRTDAGVHALGQVAHLDLNLDAKAEIIKIKFNDNLPATINILKVQPVEPKFHARYDAIARSYIYHIAARRTAFGKRYAYWIKDNLNFSAMQNVCKTFDGMHDFKSFGSAEDEQQPTKVEIRKVKIYEEGASIYIHIIGSHFLWKMVRRMVGVIIECGRENLNNNDIINFLSHYSDIPAKLTVPPSGLYLEKVFYSAVPDNYQPSWPMIISDS